MSINLKNPALIAATAALIIAVAIVGSALMADANKPHAAKPSGCEMREGAMPADCPMSGREHAGEACDDGACARLEGKVTSVGEDGSLTLQVRPDKDAPQAARSTLGKLKAGDNVSVMMMVEKSSETLASAKSAAYVCPMHPKITSNKPGRCSECGMDLVKNSSK